MPIYEYISPYPAIFFDLTVGAEGVSVTRAGEEEPADLPVGSTITLEQGDLLTVPDEYEHAFLQDQNPEPPAVPADKTGAPASNKKGK
jgi:hypothetical protein